MNMSPHFKHPARALGILALLAPVAACGNSAIGGDQESGDSDTVRIGISTALTDYSEYGVPMRDSIQLAIDDFNDSDACPQDVELISYSDSMDPAKAQTNVRTLVNDDNVDFLMSPAGSAAALAVLPIVEGADKLMIVTTPQTPTIVTPEGSDEPYPNVFSFSLPNDLEANFLVSRVSQYSRVAVIAESSPYGDSAASLLQQGLEGTSTEIVATERYEQGATDVTAQVAKVGRETPDAIIVVGLGPDAATIRQAIARLDLLDVPMYTTYGASTPSYLERAGTLADGTIAVQFAAYDGEEPQNAEAKAFAEEYVDEIGHDASYGDGDWPIPAFGGTPASSHDAASVLLQAFEQAGCSTDTSKVAEALESGETFTGVRGDYTFSPTNHVAMRPEMLVARQYVVKSADDVSYRPVEEE